MKKITALFMALSLLAAVLFTNTVILADDLPYISLYAEEREDRGVVEVSAIIYDNPGIAGYSFEVEYDKDKFTVGDTEVNDYFSENGMSIVNADEEGKVIFTWSDSSNYTEDDMLFKIYFVAPDKIPDNYEFKLTYDKNNISNQDFETVEIETQDVSVGAPTPSPSPSADPLNVNISNPFTDVHESDWHYKYVMYCLANKLFYGVSDTSFAPQTQMTRSMFVTVLYRLVGNGATASNTSAFEDVKADSWYGPAVYWAYENGLVTGTTGKKFAPEELITREQMMVIIYNYYKGTPVDYTLTFSDTALISQWAKDAVRFCVSKDIISGRENNTLAPTEGLTRAEASKMFFTVATTLSTSGDQASAEGASN